MLLSGQSALTEVAAKLWRYGLPAVEEDLVRTGGSVADALRRALARAAHLLARAESERELSDALMLRLTGVPELASMVESCRATLSGPGLTSRWPMSDQPAPALARVLDGEEGHVGRCIWSPDGRRLVSISDGIQPDTRHGVRLWDARTWRPGPTLDHGVGWRNRVQHCVLPSSGEWVATCAADTVWIWDVDSGDLRGMFDGRLEAAAPDGAWLAIGESHTTAGRRRIKLHRMPDGQLCGELEAMAPDGTCLAIVYPAQLSTTGQPGRVALYRMPEGRLVDVFSWHPGTVARAATALDAARMVTVDNGWLRIRELPGGRIQHEFNVDSDRADRFLLAPDGSWLAAEIGPHQTRTRVWDTATGEVRATIECPLGQVHTVAPDGSWIAVTPDDGRALLLDVTGGRSIPIPLGEHSSRVTSYAASPDGARLAARCQDGTIWLWDLGVAEQPPDPRRVPLSSCAVAPEGSWLATTDDTRLEQGRIAIWDVTTGHRRRVFGNGRYGSCVVAPDATWLATAGSDDVLIWEVATGRLRHRIECAVRPGEALLSAAKNYVIDLAVAPDGSWLAAACEDGTVRLLDVATGQTRDILDHPAIHGRMLGCVVAPDAGWLAYSGVGGTVIHDLSSRTSRKADSAGRVLDVSPDGSLLASGEGCDVRIWAAATGETMYVLRGHIDFAMTCRWSPDGSRLASIGDTTVGIWAAANGEIETTIRLYADPTDCCWLSNEPSLAVTSQQGLHLFDLTDGRPTPIIGSAGT